MGGGWPPLFASAGRQINHSSPGSANLCLAVSADEARSEQAPFHGREIKQREEGQEGVLPSTQHRILSLLCS